MDSVSGQASAVLAPDAYLDHLRAACRKRLRDDAAGDLRVACDMATIDPRPIDPMEPLSNRGRREVAWPSDAWSSITFDLNGAVRSAMDREPRPFPTAFVEYVAFLHLELCAREEPASGIQPGVLALPLVAAARSGESPTAFRRYVLGWRARAGSLPWNDPSMAFAASLVVALGSADDALLGSSVRRHREALGEANESGRGRFRDLVSPHDRPVWRDAVEHAPKDALAWAAAILR